MSCDENTFQKELTIISGRSTYRDDQTLLWSNLLHKNLCDVITHPCPNFVEVRAWMSNYIPSKFMAVITNPCHNFSWICSPLRRDEHKPGSLTLINQTVALLDEAVHPVVRPYGACALNGISELGVHRGSPHCIHAFELARNSHVHILEINTTIHNILI